MFWKNVETVIVETAICRMNNRLVQLEKVPGIYPAKQADTDIEFINRDFINRFDNTVL